jgi:hypothetical protein
MRSQDNDLLRMPFQINKVVFWKLQGFRGIVPHGRQYHFLGPARALPKQMKPPVTKENAIDVPPRGTTSLGFQLSGNPGIGSNLDPLPDC